MDDPVGVITLKLTSTIAAGEPGLPDAHATAVTNEDNNGNPVERYNLTVTYTPTGPKAVEYHTGTYVNTEKQPGKATDQMSSENKHTINVFEKRLQILKKDKSTGALIIDKPAAFTLYKSTNETAPTQASDIVSETGIVASGYEQVAVLTTNTSGDNAGKTDVYSVVPLHFGMFANDADKTTTYYLVETSAPEGYLKSTSVWPVTLTISEDPTN